FVSFPTDIDHIWSLVSCFIKQQMFMRKGVYILGLGTFTFCQQKLNLGNKHILIQRPVFILAEKLSHYYGFKQIKPQATDVPVGPLNFSALSAEGPFQRDAVERCVRETLHLLLRAAATRPSVSHAFPGIGVLTFRQSRVKMLFCRDFISALDGTGKLSSASASVSHSERDFSVFEPISRTNLRLSVCHEHRGVSLSIATVKSSAADASLDRACRDHRRAGQELCYVCMQRAQRNLPLYQSDESRAEREQERVLMLQEHQKDLQYFQKEEVPEHTHLLNGSYIFVVRACSADCLPQQRRYMQEAARRRQTQTELMQTELMQEAARRRQMQTELMQTELMQTELMKEAARRRQMQTELMQTELMQETTDRRCSEISPRFDARPVFGLMDSSPAALAEQRRRAQNISEELMNTANQRRRETLEKRLNEQKREREMMQRDLKEMLDERIHRYEKLRLLRAAYEESWHRSADLKHQRDREELNSRRYRNKLMIKQLGKYERCSQCKRSTANRSESNVFRDTNYVTGARLML
uniref:Coiled-coil domain containing 81 n=1 Tax=Sinocyclocheilus rhinocerous TaxID=307959 RepID=A0A673LWT7_9TELE